MRIMPGAAARRFPPPTRPRTCPIAPSRPGGAERGSPERPLMPTFVISYLIDTFHLGKRRPHAKSTVSAMIGADHDGFAQSAESARMSHRPRQLRDDADSLDSGSQSSFSAKRSRMQASICSRSDLVRQNIAKCACRLSMTRNSLFGMSFCSASQSAGGKNMSREKGTT